MEYAPFIATIVHIIVGCVTFDCNPVNLWSLCVKQLFDWRNIDLCYDLSFTIKIEPLSCEHLQVVVICSYH